MSFSWKLIRPESSLAELYEIRLRDAFPVNPSQEAGGTNVAIFSEDEIVGGFTLKPMKQLLEDVDLQRDWIVADVTGGVRLQRLWAKKGAPRETLSWIFVALVELADPNDFVYGIISLPLEFARSRSILLETTNEKLLPRRALGTCDWERGAAPTSDGKLLLKFYLDSGAALLGPPSGNENHKSIRVALGMRLKDANATKKGFVYATTHRQNLGR